ncbi:MAG: adenosine-specific kinase [Thermoprotei archaeon]|jgi:adenosine/AMP kinase
MSVRLKIVKITPPEGVNIIIGQSHFIKTTEDIYELFVTTVPHIKFGLAFCESSGPRLIRREGNDQELIELATRYALDIGAGHVFVIVIKGGYPINVLNALKNVQEVVGLYCATANPIEVIVAETEEGRGVLGVIDGGSPLGIEKEDDIKARRDFLRKIGYKLK